LRVDVDGANALPGAGKRNGEWQTNVPQAADDNDIEWIGGNPAAARLCLGLAPTPCGPHIASPNIRLPQELI
jgi:hypothetical protein